MAGKQWRLVAFAAAAGALALGASISSHAQIATTAAPVVKDANGVVLGRLAGLEGITKMTILTSTGFVVSANAVSGAGVWENPYTSLAFTDATCTGTPYLASNTIPSGLVGKYAYPDVTQSPGGWLVPTGSWGQLATSYTMTRGPSGWMCVASTSTATYKMPTKRATASAIGLPTNVMFPVTFQ